MRLLLGVGLGLMIYEVSTRLYASLPDRVPRSLTTYLAVYVPVRWVEWSVIAIFLTKSARTLHGFVLGANTIDRRWRCVGIAVSCLADVPMFIVLGGLPVGRFFC